MFLHNKELNEQLSALIASVPGAVLNFEITDKPRLIYFNDMAAKMFGYTREEYAETFTDAPFAAVHPEDLAVVKRAVDQVLTGEALLLNSKYRHVFRDGTWRWIQITGKVVRRTPGCVHTSAILIDIDDQMQKDLQQYSNALFGAYDEVLQLNLEQNSVVCRSSKSGRYTPGKAMVYDALAEKICKEVVLPQYAEDMAQFLDPVHISEGVDIKTIEYRYRNTAGEECRAQGTMLHALGYVYFICIKDVTNARKTETLIKETAALVAAASERRAGE